MTEQKKTNITITRLKIESENVITGLVYAPMEIDVDNELMLEEDILILKERMEDSEYDVKIDTDHNNISIDAEITKLTISKGDDYYTDGSLIAEVVVRDSEVWKKIENGEYNGFSIEYLITPVPALAVVEVDRIKFLESNPAKDHTHKLWVILDEKGNIVKGRTSEEGEGFEKHYHTITGNSVTNITYEHSHRIQL
jgi:hypothetical protein